jgi:hypothetical protein
LVAPPAAAASSNHAAASQPIPGGQQVPDGRAGASLAADVTTGTVVLFGGADLTPNSQAAVLPNDTWAWSSASGWRRISIGTPPGREDATAAYDETTRTILLFGGREGPGQTWSWDGSAWLQMEPASRPPAGSVPAMVYDRRLSSVVMAVVCCESVLPAASQLQVWRWDDGDWSRLPMAGPPPTVSSAPILAYDDRSGGLALLSRGRGQARTDVPQVTSDSTLSTWDGSRWTSHYSADSPPFDPLGDHMAYDPVTGTVILFEDESGGGKTWSWDGSNWRPIKSPSQAPAFAGGMVTDFRQGRLLLFGGPRRTANLAQVWSWTGTEWSLIMASDSAD